MLPTDAYFMESNGYFAARTFTFPQIQGSLGFDVFLRLGPNKYTKVFSRGTPLERERLEAYILKGTKYLYIQQNDRLSFLQESLRILKTARAQGHLEREEVLQVLDEIAEQSLMDVFHRRTFDQKTQVLVRSVVESYFEIAHQNVQIFPKLFALARNKPAALRHMIMTAIFSILLAKALDPKDTRLMYNASYAGFVHDIGLAHIAVEKDEHSLSLTPLEHNEIRKHPKLGAELLQTAGGVPPEVITAVLQHHEGCDGGGYPQGLRIDQISAIARIVRLTEEFSSLISGSGGNFPLPAGIAANALSKNPQIDQQLLSVFNKMLKL